MSNTVPVIPKATNAATNIPNGYAIVETKNFTLLISNFVFPYGDSRRITAFVHSMGSPQS